MELCSRIRPQSLHPETCKSAGGVNHLASKTAGMGGLAGGPFVGDSYGETRHYGRQPICVRRESSEIVC
jgi:hypothetical protein